MKVELISYTKLSVVVNAIRTCWDSHDKGGCYTSPTDDINEKDKALIDRVGNKNKHSSTLEHLIMTFKLEIREDALIQLLENKYVLYKKPFLTLNVRSFIDMLNDEKYYLPRNIYLMRIFSCFPKEYKYLIEEHMKNFLGERKILDECHYCYENGIIEKFRVRNKKDHCSIPFYKLPEVNSDGYFVINGVKLKDKIRSEFHHRIIGTLFIDNKEGNPFINHIDGNKKNNNKLNLEWVTSSENERHSYDILMKQIWNKNLQLPSGYEYKGKIRRVGQYTLDGVLVKEWFNPSIASIEGGFRVGGISAACLGDIKTHRGFIWKYIGEK